MAKNKKNNNFRDSDADGLSDRAEEALGTDPNNPDTDNDGMSDGDEVVRGRNPRGPGMLRDLFIPHQGNNYHPHALHPQRVLFHAASALAIKAAVVVFMLALPVTAWLTPDVLLEQQQKIIALTNAVRRNLGIAELAESALLNTVAFTKAQDMLVGQYFAHMSPEKKSLSGFLGDAGYPYAVAGENLAMGFADAESVVNAWVKSPTHYDNLVDAAYRDIGVGLSSGPFNGRDTTLVAQYFGTPYLADASAAPVSEPDSQTDLEFEALEEPADPEHALGASVAAAEPAPEPLVIDTAASMVYAAAADAGGGTVVRAEVFITGATQAAVMFAGNRVSLAPDPQDPALWTASTLMFETGDERLFNPVVLPSVAATDASGAVVTADISWDNIVPVKPSLTSQYFFMKQQDSGIIHSLLAVSSLYFKLLLGLAVASLLLMVFIEIKNQHPKHIASGLGLIALLALAIML